MIYFIQSTPSSIQFQTPNILLQFRQRLLQPNYKIKIKKQQRKKKQYIYICIDLPSSSVVPFVSETSVPNPIFVFARIVILYKL